jgi:predicted phage tail protein
MADAVDLIDRCGNGSFDGSRGSFGRFLAAAIAQAVAVASVAVRAIVSSVPAVTVSVAAISAVVVSSMIAEVAASLQLTGIVTFLSNADRDQRHHQQSLQHETNGNEMRTNSNFLCLSVPLTTARRAISNV